MIKKILSYLMLAKDFLFRDVWRLSLSGISPVQAFFVKQVKIFLVTIRGFKENKVALSASALTYYSLMAVVPVAAMAFGIAKGFGLEQMLQKELTSKLNGQEEVLNWIITFANSMLERTKGGIIAGVGIVILFWSVMQVLSNIETSFNSIWQVKKGRTIFRKFSDYFSIMFIAPIFIILSSSITVYITTQISSIVKSIQILGYFAPLIRIFINLIPYVLIWMLFTFIYKVMPNTIVKFWPAAISGIIAGTAFQITQWAYVKFQISVSSYNAIYGSFAALPLFLLWLHTGWLIVLFGAELSFAGQNYEKYEFENEASNISPRYKKNLALVMVQYIVKKFAEGSKAPEIEEISHNLQIPARISREIMNALTDARIISEISPNGDGEPTFQPAVDINMITVKYVIDKIDTLGLENLNIAACESMKRIEEIMNSFNATLNSSKENVLLKDI